MTDIPKTLMKIKGRVRDYLTEMWPELAEAIKFAHDDNFQEWFGMLWKLHEWQAVNYNADITKLNMSTTKSEVAMTELGAYTDLTDYGYISVVDIEGQVHLIDGYHRVLLARERGVEELPAVLWTKIEIDEHNDHPNCGKIRTLIAENL